MKIHRENKNHFVNFMADIISGCRQTLNDNFPDSIQVLQFVFSNTFYCKHEIVYLYWKLDPFYKLIKLLTYP